MAYDDRPLPIGFGQTISQPYMVARATELAEPTPRDRALEVGAGCGYQAAVLGELCNKVFAVEIIPELAARARRTLAELGYSNVVVDSFDGSPGWAEHAPFDAILVSAGAPRVPPLLVDQLADGGRLVIPVGRAARAGAGVDSPPRRCLRDVVRHALPLRGSAGQVRRRRMARRRPKADCRRRLVALALLGLPGAIPTARPPMHPENPRAWYIGLAGRDAEQIAARAGVPPEDILEINGLARAERRAAGQDHLRARGRGNLPPGGGGRQRLQPRALRSAATFRHLAGERGRRARPGRFVPIDRAAVGSPFGTRDGAPHEGIDLPAPIGTPVYAAADGAGGLTRAVASAATAT